MHDHGPILSILICQEMSMLQEVIGILFDDYGFGNDRNVWPRQLERFIKIISNVTLFLPNRLCVWKSICVNIYVCADAIDF